MKNIRLFLRYTAFFFLISLVLSGESSQTALLVCAIVSATSSLLVLFIFKVPTKIELNFFKVIRFIFVVIGSIYTSTIQTLLCYVKRNGKIPTYIEKLPLKTKSGVYRLFICQAITLTPGTVSVKSKSGSVNVLKIKTESLESAKKFDEIFKAKS